MLLSGYQNVFDIFLYIEQGWVGARARVEIRPTRELVTGEARRGLGELADDIEQIEAALPEAARVITGDPIVTTQELSKLQRLPIPEPLPEPIIEPEPTDPAPAPTPAPVETGTPYDAKKLSGAEYENDRQFIINGLLGVFLWYIPLDTLYAPLFSILWNTDLTHRDYIPIIYKVGNCGKLWVF